MAAIAAAPPLPLRTAAAFAGLAYSTFPHPAMDRLTIWQAAPAKESLLLVLVGICVALPMIIGYARFPYWVFLGKARSLSYGGWSRDGRHGISCRDRHDRNGSLSVLRPE